MKKQTKILLAVLVMIIAIVIGSQIYIKNQPETSLFPESNTEFNSETALKTSPLPDKNTVTVSLDFGDGKIISSNIYAQTAFDALEKITKEKNLELIKKDYKFGMMVSKVGSKENSGDKNWMFYVNGKASNLASDRHVLNPGDKVEWKFEKTK